jgi:hypothetical protein
MMDEIKHQLDELGYSYFDSTADLFPSEEYADQCHLLKGGHVQLARALVNNASFRRWLDSLN